MINRMLNLGLKFFDKLDLGIVEPRLTYSYP